MPISPYKVKFNMGENATDSNPPIEAGQILLDKAGDKQCLFVDVDDSTRLQVKDPTKMDKWGEVNSYGDPYTYIEPSTSIVLGHTTLSGGTTSTIRGLVVDKESDMIALGYIDRSDDANLTQVQQAVHSDGITSTYYNSKNNSATMSIGMSRSAGLRALLEIGYNRDNVDYVCGFEASSTYDGFALGSKSHSVSDTVNHNSLNLLVRTTHLSIEYDNQISTTKNISFLPDTDTEQFLIHGVCSPKEDIDAANKQYVDQKVSEVQTTWTDW